MLDFIKILTSDNKIFRHLSLVSLVVLSVALSATHLLSKNTSDLPPKLRDSTNHGNNGEIVVPAIRNYNLTRSVMNENDFTASIGGEKGARLEPCGPQAIPKAK